MFSYTRRRSATPSLWLMLSQARLTKRGKTEGATLWISAAGCFTRIDIPAHQVSSDQRPYDAGVLCRSGAACPFLQIVQKSHLLSCQIHCDTYFFIPNTA